MIDYIYNENYTRLYKIYRYMDGEICTDIKLLETYYLTLDPSFITFDADAFWSSARKAGA